MIALFALALATLHAAPAEVVVREGESLAQVAQRALGDERGAAELKAINALSTDQVAAGTTLKLPGPDRALAWSALSAARNAISQAPPEAKNRADSVARLEQAEALFQSARYAEAAKAADSAWQIVSGNAGEPTRFAVEVADSGRTTVTSRSGQPVHVEAQGVVQAVYAGHTASVDRGQVPQLDGAPTPVEVPLTSPAPLWPQDAAKLRLKPTPKGLGPVRVAWTPVAGAAAYEVEVFAVPPEGRPVLVSAAKAEARLPPLAPGKYRWMVRAVTGAGVRSPPSSERTFELEDEELKLDVKTHTWK